MSLLTSDHRRNRPWKLRWEIAAVVTFKIAILLLAGFTIFGAHQRIHVNSDLMNGHLLQNASTLAQPDNR